MSKSDEGDPSSCLIETREPDAQVVFAIVIVPILLVERNDEYVSMRLCMVTLYFLIFNALET